MINFVYRINTICSILKSLKIPKILKYSFWIKTCFSDKKGGMCFSVSNALFPGCRQTGGGPLV